jgi:iron(III) transport system ATP-binding protein
MSAGTVELRNVTRRYGAVTAVDRVSFTASPGTLVTLLGPSGCGKTTTLRLVAGLELPSDGVIFIGGEDVTNRSAAERDVGMVFQSYALFPHMTVLENVGYGLAVSRMSKAEQRERARGALKLVGLEGYDDRFPSALSGGQQQRVALARAVVIEPRVLLFDEPLSNLDAKLRRRMRDEIREIQTRLGITALYVTHDQEEAMAVSDRIVVMRDGRIAQDGTPGELYDAPADRFVADFIGGANLVDCDVVAIDRGTAQVRVGRLSLALPARELAPGRATLAIRPNAIALGDGSNVPAMEATVRKATWLGSHIEYTVDTEIGQLFVVGAAGDPVHAAGTTVRMTIAGRGVTLLPA